VNLRHPENTNLHLHYNESYRGLTVMAKHAPLIREYLDRCYEVTHLALAEHPRLFAGRFDLHFPADCLFTDEDRSNRAISKFVDSLTGRIRTHRARSMREHGSVHGTSVRWFWVREEGDSAAGHQHYHFVLLLNWDAYRSLGSFNSGRDNLYRRIQAAWAGALRMDIDDADGLVYVPDNAVYKLTRDPKTSMFPDYFERISYMCKTRSKVYSHGYHAFNSSRG